MWSVTASRRTPHLYPTETVNPTTSRLQTVCVGNTVPTNRGDAVPAVRIEVAFLVLADAYWDYTYQVVVLPAVLADACWD